MPGYNTENAGKSRFQSTVSKYEQAMTAENEPENENPEPKKAEEDKLKRTAKLIVERSAETTDRRILKGNHPAYKGARTTLTNRIKKETHERMKRVAAERGVNISYQLDKGMDEFLNKYYPDVT